MVVTEQSSKAVANVLFADSKLLVYAVLDGASVPKLPQLFWEHEPQRVCLYRGELGPDLAATAPYLVKLDADSPFTDLVLKDGWGKHWGIFVLAPEEVHLRDLRKHFRTFLVVRDEAGGSMYFRYYDPRVLQVYLPTCNEEECRVLFGPIASYVVESKDGDQVLRFSCPESTVRLETIRLQPAG